MRRVRIPVNVLDCETVRKLSSYYTSNAFSVYKALIRKFRSFYACSLSSKTGRLASGG